MLVQFAPWLRPVVSTVDTARQQIGRKQRVLIQISIIVFAAVIFLATLYNIDHSNMQQSLSKFSQSIASQISHAGEKLKPDLSSSKPSKDSKPDVPSSKAAPPPKPTFCSSWPTIDGPTKHQA